MGPSERRRIIAWAHEPSMRRARRIALAILVGLFAWDDASVVVWAEAPAAEVRGSLDRK